MSAEPNLQRQISFIELEGILAQWRHHFTCWEARLATGSLIFFEMGRRILRRTNRGSDMELGSASLHVNGYRWSITKRGEPIADSDTIDRSTVETGFNAIFVHRDLLNIESEDGGIIVNFSGGLAISIYFDEEDEDMLMLYLPDNTCVIYDARIGLLVSNDNAPY